MTAAPPANPALPDLPDWAAPQWSAADRTPNPDLLLSLLPVTFGADALARARRWATFYPADEVLLDPQGHFRPQPRDQMQCSVHLYAVTRRHMEGVRPDEAAVMARMRTLAQVEAGPLQDAASRGSLPTTSSLPSGPAARLDQLLQTLG
ncbi:hypothetical protein [Deinococcus aquaticus]|uniref:Uncharacterized protein n=1 Tax=Deinococcus aquaticus TaxID=328692 RepID=A0ABY7UY49_9DEIO|nr:hypothetical protein [Deinococcus aquaticus]WDA57823.1 hypothetical protein M8445_10730 [Deinococcus aquaticus]